jgi:GTP-binding protein
VVALNKIDLPDVRALYPEVAERFARRGIELAAVSAATGEGLPPLLERVWALVRKDERTPPD